jgi:hypothetical protein
MDDGIRKLASSRAEYPTWGQYFDALEERVSSNYDVTSAQVHAAISFIFVFFRLKRFDRKQILILPQIVDWVWHEFITDTQYYMTFCDRYFGHYLHHVKARHTDRSTAFLSERFRATMRVFAEECEIDLDSLAPWGPGWECPRYRLRTYSNFFAFERFDFEPVSPAVAVINVGWITQRLIERYDLSTQQADLALEEYKAFLTTRLNPFNTTAPSAVCDIAWKEHILSTVKYHRDCARLFGSYLHRSA